MVDPRPYAVGSLQEVYNTYDVGPVLPAMGYSAQQLGEMQRTIDAADCDLVVIATPIDLRALVSISKKILEACKEIRTRRGERYQISNMVTRSQSTRGAKAYLP